MDSKLPSLAELLFGRVLIATLPSRVEPGREEHRQRLVERSAEMEINHDLLPLYPGQHVTVTNKAGKTWYPETVIKKDDTPRSYIVETPTGTKLHLTMLT